MKRTVLIIIMVLGALGILFISIARANLETVLREDKEGKLRIVPVDLVTSKDNGEQIKWVYYLPKIKIYPTNILYPIKMWRDKLWLIMIRDYCKKSNLLILIADKKIAEEDVISTNEAVDMLIEALNLCPDNEVRIYQTAEAYRQITKKMRKYLTAHEKIEKFIESKEAETY